MTDETSMLSEEGLTNVAFNKFEHATVGALYMLFCIVGVSTNFITAMTFYKDGKLLTSSKPWLHILLALANIGVVAPSPFPASSSFSGRWLYGNTVCQLYAFEGMFVGITAIGAVIALCIERYVIANRTDSKESIGWFYFWAVLMVLGNGLFWAMMPLLGWSKYAVEHTGTSCAIDWKNPDESYVSYMVTLEIFSFCLPMMIGLICLYSAHSKPTAQTTAGPSSAAQGQTTDVNQAPFAEDQLQSLCYVFILLVLMGWGPFAFLCTSSIVGGPSGFSMLAACIPPLACKLMVSAYPLAYAVTSPRFRQSFKSVLTGPEKKQE
nr:retinochrome [Peronia verruculata]